MEEIAGGLFEQLVMFPRLTALLLQHDDLRPKRFQQFDELAFFIIDTSLQRSTPRT